MGHTLTKQVRLLVALLLLVAPAMAQQRPTEPLPSEPAFSEAFSWEATYGKSPAAFTQDDWRAVIDATWGAGLPTTQKLALFDQWWDLVDRHYAGFFNMDLDINVLRDRYRPEIEAGVSRGRFAGIMSHFTYQLNELHTYLFDIPVRNTALNKGVPTLVIGQWGTNQHFGAVLTPLPDSSLLVYKALPNHPLGLQPGDVVLGYEGLAWKDLYPTLLEAELPLFLNSVNASTEEANTYYLLQAAGLNWHLFDTIDIVQYSTGDTLHFDTALLAGQRRTIWGSEQIDVHGVTWPDRNVDRVSWGVVDGHNGSKVGYVYVTSWSFDAQFNIREQFRSAIDSLMRHVDTDGLILDYRFNTGGGALARDGYALLFRQLTRTIGFDIRTGTRDHFAMRPDPNRQENNLIILADPTNSYDKPIAVLMGPGSISAGELEALRATFHPQVRLFGLPAPGGNTGSNFIDLGDSNWFASLSNSSMYRVSDHQYLVHIGLQPDTRVWLDRDDVAHGTDTVVEAAMAWIVDPTATGTDDLPRTSTSTLQAAAYPNPFHTTATLTYELPEATAITVHVYDLLGRRIATLEDAIQPAGSHRLTWDGRMATGGLSPSGTYFYHMQAGEQSVAVPVVFLR